MQRTVQDSCLPQLPILSLRAFLYVLKRQLTCLTIASKLRQDFPTDSCTTYYHISYVLYAYETVFAVLLIPVMLYQMMLAACTYGGCTTVECRSVDEIVACCVRGT